MADSLVDLILGVVDPDVVAKLAAGTGMNPVTAQNAVSAAVPAILGSIAGTVATGDGAKRIADAVANQDPAIMDNLAASAGTAGQSALSKDGTKLLGNLIGTQKLESIASAIAGANGTAPAAVKSLMGYLTPVTLGVIGQQDPSTWSDGAAIAASFAAQKSAIADAMPAGLAAAMGGVGAALGTAGAALGTATSAASAGVSRIGGAASSAANAVPAAPPIRSSTQASTEPSGGVPSWIWIALAVVVLGALAWYFTRSGTPKMAEKPATAVTQAAPAVPAVPAAPAAPAVPAAPAATTPAAPVVAVPAVPAPALPASVADLGKQATAALDGVKATIAGIKDADTAKAALPKLTEITGQLDKLTGLAAVLPADAKKTLAGAIAPALPELNGQIDKMLALPGVGDVAKPAIDGLRAKLAALTGA